MKPLLCSALLLLTFSLSAQAPVPLARGNVPGEPHHHLKIENEYVRAYYVEVPPHEDTLLHQHDNDYLFVTLGATEVINAVLGKPEIKLALKDGEVRFTRGGFAHVARNLGDKPFRNVTIELLKPQGEAHNICREVIAGPMSDCSGPPLMRSPELRDKFVLLFETNHILVKQLYVEKSDHMDVSAGRNAALLVALTNGDLELRLSGQPAVKFVAGGVAWVPPGQKFSVSAPDDIPVRFLEITFRDDAPFAKP